MEGDIRVGSNAYTWSEGKEPSPVPRKPAEDKERGKAQESALHPKSVADSRAPIQE
jgi:hypothetical protein